LNATDRRGGQRTKYKDEQGPKGSDPTLGPPALDEKVDGGGGPCEPLEGNNSGTQESSSYVNELIADEDGPKDVENYRAGDDGRPGQPQQEDRGDGLREKDGPSAPLHSTKPTPAQIILIRMGAGIPRHAAIRGVRSLSMRRREPDTDRLCEHHDSDNQAVAMPHDTT
jgi:hypothetical protein